MVAALLKDQGYQVIGVTWQLYDHGDAEHRKGACCAGQDIHDARRVAAQLDIPHYVLDYEERFRKKVIDRFARSYAEGETPVPLHLLQQRDQIRRSFRDRADLGADVLATGHYVSSRPDGQGGRELYRAQDAARDQSYFLFATTTAQLRLLRFPLGEMQKADVRQLAHRYGLLVADKADSQDICFVPSGKYSDFIERIWPEAAVPGKIVHIDGHVLGDHAGVIHYTIGQRRGLGLSVHGAAAGEPLYVVKLDAARAEVVVGPRSALATRRARLRALNWIGDGTLDDLARDGRDLFVRVRSTRPPVPGFLHIDGDDIYVDFATDEDGVAPGQACVFYASDLTDARVLGGGFISATESATQMPHAPSPTLATAGRH